MWEQNIYDCIQNKMLGEKNSQKLLVKNTIVITDDYWCPMWLKLKRHGLGQMSVPHFKLWSAALAWVLVKPDKWKRTK